MPLTHAELPLVTRPFSRSEFDTTSKTTPLLVVLQITLWPPRLTVIPSLLTMSGAAQSAVSVPLELNVPHAAIACALPTCTAPAQAATSTARRSIRRMGAPFSLEHDRKPSRAAAQGP